MSKNYAPFPLDRIEAIETDIALLSELRNSRTRLLQLAAEINDISLSDLRGPSRVSALSYKRWRLCYLLRRLNISYGLIGHMVNRDHSSVLYGIRRVEATLEAVQSGHALPVSRVNAFTPRPNFPFAPFVYWNGRDGRWLVRYTENRKRKVVGTFVNYDEAVKARNCVMPSLARDSALRTHVEAA